MIRRAVLAIALLLTASSAAGAETIAGTVLDPSGVPIARALVELITERGTVATDRTSVDGAFTFDISGMPLLLQINVGRTGFESRARIDVGFGSNSPIYLSRQLIIIERYGSRSASSAFADARDTNNRYTFVPNASLRILFNH